MIPKRTKEQKQENKGDLFLENIYFYCYSKPLKDFLLENDLRYVIKSIHEKTKKKYWLFEGTDELNKLLSEWRLRKH